MFNVVGNRRGGLTALSSMSLLDGSVGSAVTAGTFGTHYREKVLSCQRSFMRTLDRHNRVSSLNLIGAVHSPDSAASLPVSNSGKAFLVESLLKAFPLV